MLTYSSFFFFTDPAPTEFYTLSLHDALPISLGQGNQMELQLHAGERTRPRVHGSAPRRTEDVCGEGAANSTRGACTQDRKSTRLNSSHRCISYAVFCLKKKK